MTSRISYLAAAMLCGAIMFEASEAHALCTVSGLVQAEILDTYYCDTNHMASCTGWKESNLDTGFKPLKRMAVVWKSGSTTFGTGFTDAWGFYSITNMSLPNCQGSHTVFIHFMSPSENPVGFPNFMLVGPAPSYAVHATSKNFQGASGPSASVNFTIFSNGANPLARIATFYYTIDSAIQEMSTWSTRLNYWIGGGNGGGFMVEVHSAQPWSNADDLDWGVKLGWDRFAWGGNTRHELGHLAHAAIHDRKIRRRHDNSCISLNYNYSGLIHNEWSCEYVSTATWEALGTFFGVRSLVTEVGTQENNAFFCFGADTVNPLNRDDCSQAAVAMLDDDRLQGWGNITFVGVGDTYATAVTNCTRQHAASCTCPNTDGNAQVCDETPPNLWYQTNGHRTETNIYRFFWDVIDTNNDSGMDNSNISVGTFVQELQDMTCTNICNGSQQDDCGIDGTCNEPSSPTCWPIDGTEVPHATGDRESYNLKDIGNLWASSLDDERVLNCVQNTPDL